MIFKLTLFFFKYRYLGCIEVSDLSLSEQVQHAFFLGLAALLGEGVYNLGELVCILMKCTFL